MMKITQNTIAFTLWQVSARSASAENEEERNHNSRVYCYSFRGGGKRSRVNTIRRRDKKDEEEDSLR